MKYPGHDGEAFDVGFADQEFIITNELKAILECIAIRGGTGYEPLLAGLILLMLQRTEDEAPRILRPSEALTPDQFTQTMESLSHFGSVEDRHRDTDNLLCEQLRKLGFDDGVQIFLGAEKWYC